MSWTTPEVKQAGTEDSDMAAIFCYALLFIESQQWSMYLNTFVISRKKTHISLF